MRIPGAWRVGLGVGLALLTASCARSALGRPKFVGLQELLTRPADVAAPPFPDANTLPKLTRQVPGGRPALERPAYVVGPLDQLVVMVWGRPDLGSQVPVGGEGRIKASVVRENGTLTLPFLPPLPVAGLTVDEIRAEIQQGYAAVIENPQVEVAIHQCASQAVQIGGAATSPGSYYLCDGRVTLGEFLTFARGLTPVADLARGVLTRDGQPYRLDYREGEQGKTAASEILMRSGDAVYFPPIDERIVYVFGEVRRQGAFRIPQQGMSLLDALGQAEGIDTSTSGGVFLMRRKGSELAAYRISFNDILQSPEIPLAHGDRIFVATARLEHWSRFWQRAIPWLRIYIHHRDVTFTGF